MVAPANSANSSSSPSSSSSSSSSSASHPSPGPLSDPPSDAGPVKPPLSERRLAANRANAAKSTGPRSERGKSQSRLNAVRHGFRAELPVERCPRLRQVADDDPNAFDDLHQALAHDLRPRGATEQLLVERLARAAWRLRRTEAAEVAMLDRDERDRITAVIRNHVIARRMQATYPGPTPHDVRNTTVGEALARQFAANSNDRRGGGGGGGSSGALPTLMQYQARLEGQLRSALRDLRLLREDKAAWAADDARRDDDAQEWTPPRPPRRKPRRSPPDLRQILATADAQVEAMSNVNAKADLDAEEQTEAEVEGEGGEGSSQDGPAGRRPPGEPHSAEAPTTASVRAQPKGSPAAPAVVSSAPAASATPPPSVPTPPGTVRSEPATHPTATAPVSSGLSAPATNEPTAASASAAAQPSSAARVTAAPRNTDGKGQNATATAQPRPLPQKLTGW